MWGRRRVLFGPLPRRNLRSPHPLPRRWGQLSPRRRLLLVPLRDRSGGRRSSHLSRPRRLRLRRAALRATERLLLARLCQRHLRRTNLRAGGRQLPDRRRLLRRPLHGRRLRGARLRLSSRWSVMRRRRRLLRPALHFRRRRRRGHLPAASVLPRFRRGLQLRLRLLRRILHGRTGRRQQLPRPPRLSSGLRALRHQQGLLLGTLPAFGNGAFPVRRRLGLQPGSGTVRCPRKLLLRHLHGHARRDCSLRSQAWSDGAAPDAEGVPRPRLPVREVGGVLRRRRRQLSRRRKQDASLPGAIRRRHLPAGGAPLFRRGAVLRRTMPPRYPRHADLRQHLRALRRALRRVRGLLRRRPLPRSGRRPRLYPSGRTDAGNHLYGDRRCLRWWRAHLLRRHGLRVAGERRDRLRGGVLVPAAAQSMGAILNESQAGVWLLVVRSWFHR
jgi:hypothetical protein